MNFSKNVLALSIALAVGSSTAASKPQDDDSVHQWGRWAVLVPEAGGEADPFIKVEGSRDLRPEDAQEYERRARLNDSPVEPPVEPPVTPPIPPEPPVVEGHCQAGASCGYATYAYSYYNYGGYDEERTGGHGARVPANIDLDVQFAPTDTVEVAAIGLPPTADGGEVGVTADFTVAPTTPHSNYPPVADRHAEGYYYENDDGTGYWSTYANNFIGTAPDGGEGYSRTYSGISGGMVPGLTDNTTAGWWGDGVEDYSYETYVGQWSGRDGSYVTGTATNMAFLDTLNAGSVEADYVGFAMHSGVDVAIHIDFGDSTWSGTWNGGRDGNVDVVVDNNGVRHVEGDVGFRVDAGHLSGPNLIADRLSADDGTVEGAVEGSFFGSQAQVVGGLSDITKTVTEDTVGEDGITYDSARNVDTFVTVKEELADQVGDAFRSVE